MAQIFEMYGIQLETSAAIDRMELVRWRLLSSFHGRTVIEKYVGS